MGVILAWYFLKPKKQTSTQIIVDAAKAETTRMSTALKMEQAAVQANALKDAEIARLKQAAIDAKASGDNAEADRQAAAAALAEAQKANAEQSRLAALEAENQKALAASLAAKVKADETARMEAIAQENLNAVAKANAAAAAATTYEQAKTAFVQQEAATMAADVAVADQQSIAIQRNTTLLSTASQNDSYLIALNQKYADMRQVLNSISEDTNRWVIESQWSTLQTYQKLLAQFIDEKYSQEIIDAYKRVVDSAQHVLDFKIAAANADTARLNLQNAVSASYQNPVSGFSSSVRSGKSPFH